MDVNFDFQISEIYYQSMGNQFTAVVQKDGDWYIAYCLEVREANGQGKSEKEAIKNLEEAIKLIRQDNESEIRSHLDKDLFEIKPFVLA